MLAVGFSSRASSAAAPSPVMPEEGLLGWGLGEDARWLAYLLPAMWEFSRYFAFQTLLAHDSILAGCLSRDPEQLCAPERLVHRLALKLIFRIPAPFRKVADLLTGVAHRCLGRLRGIFCIEPSLPSRLPARLFNSLVLFVTPALLLLHENSSLTGPACESVKPSACLPACLCVEGFRWRSMLCECQACQGQVSCPS